jgi:hypothetical protein
MSFVSSQQTRATEVGKARTQGRTAGAGSPLAMLQRSLGNRAILAHLGSSGKVSASSLAPAKTVFTLQTFIPDKYVPGTGWLGYGDDRGFGKPGDRYRTFQQIVVPSEQRAEGDVEPVAEAKTGVSETAVPLLSGQASAGPLHMKASREDAHSTIIAFDASITNGATGGGLLPAIDFSGALALRTSGPKQVYGFYIRHDAFPAYEAFIDGKPIYRWSYPAGGTVSDLIGDGTAIQATRKTGDAPGGTVAGRDFEGFGGGSFGGGGSGGTF